MKISSGIVLQVLGSAIDTVTTALENPTVVETKNLLKQSLAGGIKTLGFATQSEVTRLEEKVHSLEEALKSQQPELPGLHVEATPQSKTAHHSSGAV